MLALSSLAVAASTVNFSGKWAIQVPGRGAQMQPTILVLNHVGNEVTGTVTPAGRGGGGSGAPATGREILGGKVEGDTISFYVWAGSDRPSKTTYKGTISGDEIAFTVAGGGGGGGMGGGRGQTGPQQVTAKRTK